MRADRRDPVIAEIKKYKPTVLLVHMRTGDPRQLPIPTKSNRWELLSTTLERLEWTRIECLDREKNLLGIVEGDEDEPGGADVDDRDERMARLISDVIDRTTMRVSAMFQAQMTGFVELASTTTQGLRAVQETYAQALRVQAATMASQHDDNGDMDVMKMLQAAAMLKGSPTTQPAPRPPVQVRPMPPRRPAPSPAQSVDGKSEATGVKQAI